MSRTLTWLCLVSLGAALSGCSHRGYEGEQRFPISGKVTVDGQPLDLGVIAFMPQGGQGRVAGSPIRDGAYAVPEEKGPTAATYQVQIHWNKKTGKQIPNPMSPDEMIDDLMEGLPEKYHAKSELTAKVSPEQTTFDFDLKTE